MLLFGVSNILASTVYEEELHDSSDAAGGLLYHIVWFDCLDKYVDMHYYTPL